EQCAALVLVRIFHTLVFAHFARQAKWLAVNDPWKPVASVALSLKVRRLADYTSVALETGLAIVTAASIGLLAYHHLSPLDPFGKTGWRTRHNIRALELPVLLIYLQLGGLLVKHGLVKWRMWLPGERTQEYLRWREEFLKHLLWVCDYLRALCTAVL